MPSITEKDQSFDETFIEAGLMNLEGEGGHSIGMESWSNPNDQLPSGMGAKDFRVKRG